MSQEQNGTTPPKGATLPSAPAVVTPSPATTPAPTGASGQSDGKVTIDLKEYRDLQRAKARTLSFDKRVALKDRTNQPINNSDGSPADPDMIERVNQAEKGKRDAERRALQLEVKGKVRDLLDNEEFKALPRSTKELILRNPAMLSEADNLDEAMIDIEEFVRDQVLSLDKVTVAMPGATPPKGSETPPVVNSGSPAPVTPVGLEDLSNLRGPARSQAAIRNKLKQHKGTK